MRRLLLIAVLAIGGLVPSVAAAAPASAGCMTGFKLTYHSQYTTEIQHTNSCGSVRAWAFSTAAGTIFGQWRTASGAYSDAYTARGHEVRGGVEIGGTTTLFRLWGS
jgi:hypothetical protein